MHVIDCNENMNDVNVNVIWVARRVEVGWTDDKEWRPTTTSIVCLCCVGRWHFANFVYTWTYEPIHNHHILLDMGGAYGGEKGPPSHRILGLGTDSPLRSVWPIHLNFHVWSMPPEKIDSLGMNSFVIISVVVVRHSHHGISGANNGGLGVLQYGAFASLVRLAKRNALVFTDYSSVSINSYSQLAD